jgi:hypothetical protein
VAGIFRHVDEVLAEQVDEPPGPLEEDVAAGR